MSKDRYFASHVSDKPKVASWTYERSRWGRTESTGTNTLQADVKTLETVVKVYAQRSRYPDIQLVPVTVGWVLEYHIHLDVARHVMSLNELLYRNRYTYSAKSRARNQTHVCG
jgi:hypothetical protein